MRDGTRQARFAALAARGNAAPLRLRAGQARPALGASRVRAVGSVALAVCLALGSPASAMGPLQKNHPLVEQGQRAYEDGRYEDALKAFDQAKKELPSSAAVEFNRGNAFYKMGRHEDAKQAYRRAGETDRADLKEKDYYNLGNVWAEMGNAQEAIASYRKALTLDPTDEQARHNLEVVLRNLPPPQQRPDGGTDGGPPDAGDGGSSDAGRDGGSDGGGDGGSDGGGDGGSDGGGSKGGGDGGQTDGGDRGQGEAGPRQPQSMGDAGIDAGTPEPEELGLDGGYLGDIQLNKEDAERLLDSMKQNEKNLQLWRFQQKKRPRKQNEKDW
ncbi:MAG TPA: tetratricopeptide repeat protein [Myxococcaceae bacterium]|nr:tetratricopeptide repeat protein [Myxococcaceae bacterium]